MFQVREGTGPVSPLRVSGPLMCRGTPRVPLAQGARNAFRCPCAAAAWALEKRASERPPQRRHQNPGVATSLGPAVEGRGRDRCDLHRHDLRVAEIPTEVLRRPRDTITSRHQTRALSPNLTTGACRMSGPRASLRARPTPRRARRGVVSAPEPLGRTRPPWSRCHTCWVARAWPPPP